VQAHYVPHVFFEGRDEDQAHTCSDFHHRPVEVEGPTLGLDL
jgi:hypothetical protein